MLTSWIAGPQPAVGASLLTFGAFGLTAKRTRVERRPVAALASSARARTLAPPCGLLIRGSLVRSQFGEPFHWKTRCGERPICPPNPPNLALSAEHLLKCSRSLSR